MSQSSDLSSLETLLALIRSGEGIPVHVRITPSDELQALRDETQHLRDELKFTREKLKRCEGYLGDEMAINSRLCELLRENGIKIPRGFNR